MGDALPSMIAERAIAIKEALHKYAVHWLPSAEIN